MLLDSIPPSQYVTIYNSNNHSLITFAEVLLHFFIAAGSVCGTSLGCRAEIRTRTCLTASQRTTNWAALHPIRVRIQESRLNADPRKSTTATLVCKLTWSFPLHRLLAASWNRPETGGRCGGCRHPPDTMVADSAFISSVSGSSILGWIPIRIQGFNDQK